MTPLEIILTITSAALFIACGLTASAAAGANRQVRNLLKVIDETTDEVARLHRDLKDTKAIQEYAEYQRGEMAEALARANQRALEAETARAQAQKVINEAYLKTAALNYNSRNLEAVKKLLSEARKNAAKGSDTHEI